MAPRPLLVIGAPRSGFSLLISVLIEVRSAARVPSDPAWKMIDPQNPKSIWYFTSAPWVGFRVVRPLAVPEVKEMHRMWNTGPGPKE